MENKRIQRKRIKGWRKPKNTVNVARSSKWGNPYNWKDYVDTSIADPVSAGETRESVAKGYVTKWFGEALLDGLLPFTEDDVKRELKGKTLMCWCKEGDPCHGEVLLEVANS